MKKIILLPAIIFFAFSFSQAQISKGTLWLGGSIGYSSSNSEQNDYKQQNLNIYPAIGKAVKENTIVGIQLNIGGSKYETGSEEQKLSTYGVDLFLRKYWEIVNRFYAYGHLRTGYSATKENLEASTYDRKATGWTVGIGASPGIAFALNKRFQLEAGFNNLFNLSYSQAKTELHTVSTGDISSYKNKNFSAGLNFENSSSLVVGLRFLIPK